MPDLNFLRIGTSPDGETLDEALFCADQVAAPDGTTAQEHMEDAAVHVPATSAANSGKVLKTGEDGEQIWGVDQAGSTDVYSKAEVDEAVGAKQDRIEVTGILQGDGNGGISAATIQHDVVLVSSEAEIAASGVRPGGLVIITGSKEE